MTAAVSQSEAHLLSLARTAVGLAPAADVMRLLAQGVTPPSALGPTARRLLSELLARGTVLALARNGGWRPWLEDRLWERCSPPTLRFTGAVVRLLQWLLRTPLGDPEPPALVTKTPFTAAEGVVVAVLLDQLRGTGLDEVVARQAPVRDSPLVALAHTALLARVAPLGPPPGGFELAELAVLIDGLSGLMARSWVHGERLKREVSAPSVLRRIGEAQALVLTDFLDAVDRGGRRRLAGFLLEAGAAWLGAARGADDLSRSLSPDSPLRDRAEARKAAGALLRALGRLHDWDRAHRAVRFIDDGYEVAQALVREWERMGEVGFATARTLLGELEALPAGAAEAAPAPN